MKQELCLTNREITLKINRFPAVIGRNKDSADYRIDDSTVSRAHCEISSKNGRFFIKDLGSSNGTYVSGIQLMKGERMAIESEDRIQIGNQKLTVRLNGDTMDQRQFSQEIIIKFYRVPSFVAAGAKANIYLDGKMIGSLNSGGRIETVISFGTHTIGIDHSSLGIHSKTITKYISISPDTKFAEVEIQPKIFRIGIYPCCFEFGKINIHG